MYFWCPFMLSVYRSSFGESISGSIINFKNVQVSNDDEILLGWADYFKDLATPTSMPEFDKAVLQQAENDVKNLYNPINATYKGDLLLLASAISSDKMRAAIMGISPCANPFCSLFCCSVIRQGGVWSPTAYKIFINSLLDTLERNQLGAYLGTHYCGTPTVADDVTLISNDPYELQSMFDIQRSHANSKRYLISEQKSSILTFNCTKEHKWYCDSPTTGIRPIIKYVDSLAVLFGRF
jgi:hypothetical protein